MSPRDLTAPILSVALVLLLSATSAATGASNAQAVGQQPPSNVSPPLVSGSAQVGQTLTADPGDWSGPAMTFEYQWQLCDSSGNSCVDVVAATSTSYAPAVGDVGSTLRVAVTASNKNGATSAVSAPSALVAAAPATAPTMLPPSPAGSPTISGTAQQGQTLTADAGSWSGTLPLSYAYQWQRCDSSGGGCAPVAGATAQTYALTSTDVGATMRAAVTASNTAGSATAGSLATGLVAATTSTTTASSSSRLTWAPPQLVNPITVPIQDTGLAAPTLPGQSAGQPWVVNLDPSQDYILQIHHRHTGPIEGLSVNGGHNVVIIGGEITDDLALAPDSTAEYRQGGLIFHNQTGVVHVEGVLFDGNPLQALIFDSRQATFQVENCRIQGVYMWNENFSTPHSDAVVTWSSPPEIRFDKLTTDYDNTGFALYSGLSTPGVFPGHVTFKRTNLRNSSTPYGFEALYRQGNATRLDIDQMYVETGWGRGSTTEDFPPLGPVHVTLNGGIALGGDPTYNGDFRAMTLTGDGVSQGSYVDFVNPSLDNVWGVAGAPARVYYGVPPGGDFVPAGVAGANYVSPGYQ